MGSLGSKKLDLILIEAPSGLDLMMRDPRPDDPPACVGVGVGTVGSGTTCCGIGIRVACTFPVTPDRTVTKFDQDMYPCRVSWTW
jgi:hypothetical protein